MPASPTPISFNGAATFRSRKVAAEMFKLRKAYELQWGRDLSVAEGSSSFARSIKRKVLQWGRDLSVAEGAKGPPKDVLQNSASMGPRPFGRGRLWSRHALAAMRSLQWGRDLSVAEGSYADVAARVVASASMGPRPFGRGRRRAAAARREGRRASMGPRPFGRGRMLNAYRFPAIAASFNGAATFRSRKGPCRFPPAP